jgi:predicted ATPase
LISVVRDKEHVVGAIASAIGLVTQRVDLEDALFNYLHDRKALLILDSCEHLIEKAAEVADCLFQRAPALCMLATSRETLQIPCERVFRLHPLECHRKNRVRPWLKSFPIRQFGYSWNASARGAMTFHLATTKPRWWVKSVASLTESRLQSSLPLQGPPFSA